ncbi:hypothetical protein [Bradyrhizobium sp.]|uniref:hypothetical protein n=1 Tax=Bradyrhizobium sp. TaxID=376 RepID=UPI002637DD88|nr:hypothetical protein [Bradyrhizobium sp.]
MPPSLSMSPRKPYPSLGKCIYCLKKFQPIELKKEHIVPLGLNGIWVIKEATCEPCRRLTSEGYENDAMQTSFLLPRLMLELKRRKKTAKKLPIAYSEYTAHLASVGHLDPLELELSQYPPIVQFPDFKNAAGKLIGIDHTNMFNGEIRFWFRNVSDLINYRSNPPPGKTSIREVTKPGAMATTVAKIAYCFAVAERGLEAFHGDEIRQLLRCERDDVFNFFGATLTGESLPSGRLHWIATRERGSFMTVIVHLFSSLGAPTYEVVVGSI